MKNSIDRWSEWGGSGLGPTVYGAIANVETIGPTVYEVFMQQVSRYAAENQRARWQQNSIHALNWLDARIKFHA